MSSAPTASIGLLYDVPSNPPMVRQQTIGSTVDGATDPGHPTTGGLKPKAPRQRRTRGQKKRERQNTEEVPLEAKVLKSSDNHCAGSNQPVSPYQKLDGTMSLQPHNVIDEGTVHHVFGVPAVPLLDKQGKLVDLADYLSKPAAPIGPEKIIMCHPQDDCAHFHGHDGAHQYQYGNQQSISSGSDDQPGRQLMETWKDMTFDVDPFDNWIKLLEEQKEMDSKPHLKHRYGAMAACENGKCLCCSIDPATATGGYFAFMQNLREWENDNPPSLPALEGSMMLSLEGEEVTE